MHGKLFFWMEWQWNDCMQAMGWNQCIKLRLLILPCLLHCLLGCLCCSSIAVYTVADVAHIRKKSSALSFTCAASLPALITTVHHALMDCAQVRKGQSVLLHVGAGSIGLTAIYYARQLGCEVIATALFSICRSSECLFFSILVEKVAAASKHVSNLSSCGQCAVCPVPYTIEVQVGFLGK